jgi:hypothetical protein
VRRNVDVMDTPTKKTMNIALLNIPFAIVGVAIAIVPLIIGMKYQDLTDNDEVIASKLEVLDVTLTVRPE